LKDMHILIGKALRYFHMLQIWNLILC